MPDNKGLAEVRLKYLGNKLRKNRDMHQKYSEQVEDYIRKGYDSCVNEPPTEGRT